jgi:TRAP-type C4-dicarboxylate transport system substrate-binding protein
MRNWIPAACAALGLTALAYGAERAPAAVTLKFATLAPEGSAWMQAFEQIRKEVDEASGGKVRLKAYPAGVLGEEKDVLFKIRAGQVDGAGFLGFGISQICPDANALMVPLLFREYAEVDAALAALQPHLVAQSARNGFVALGWTEVGFSYLYSNLPVQTVDELRRAKPWALPGDTMTLELFKAGGVGGIPVPVGDVLVALQTGLLQTVFSPPLAAVSMQWFSRVKFRNDTKLMYSLGGLFVAQRAWDRVPEDLRPQILNICQRRLGTLRDQVRNSNAEALRVMEQNGVKTVSTTPEGLAQFLKLRDTMVEALKGKSFSADSYAQVTKALEAARAAAAAAPAAPATP